MFESKMMPGQESYTDAEYQRLFQLVAEAGACDPGERDEPALRLAAARELRKYREDNL